MPHIVTLKNLSAELVNVNERCSVADQMITDGQMSIGTQTDVQASTSSLISIMNKAADDLAAERATLEGLIGAGDE